MRLRDIVTEEVIKKSTGATYDDLESPLVRPETLLEITHIAVENRTTAYTRLIIGVADGANFSYKEDQDAPPAATVFWTPDKLRIPEGKKLRVRMIGCTGGDDLHLTYEGHVWEKEICRD
jgi:hypothetical protein